MAKGDVSVKQSDSKKPSTSVRRAKPKPKWQERLLPTMNGLLIGLTLFFFITTFGQMAYLHWSILQSPPVDINQEAGNALLDSAQTFEDQMQARELDVRSRMEVYIVTQRYRQVSVQLMAGLWTRYLGFITGMILALVGASFVLGKLREPSQRLEGKFSGFDVSLRTTSPGIILATLGVVLMFATILDKDAYEITDANVYLSSSSSLPIEPSPVATLPSLEQLLGTSTPAP